VKLVVDEAGFFQINFSSVSALLSRLAYSEPGSSTFTTPWRMCEGSKWTIMGYKDVIAHKRNSVYDCMGERLVTSVDAVVNWIWKIGVESSGEPKKKVGHCYIWYSGISRYIMAAVGW